MIVNAECIIHRENEPDMFEQIQSFFMVMQMMSPVRLNLEQVDNSDGTYTLRLRDYQLTQASLDDMNSQCQSLMARFGLKY